MSYYLIRVGEGSKYIEEAKKENFVAIGWDEVPDLNRFQNVDEIKEALKKTSYKYTPTQISTQAGQIFRFGLEIKPGDIIISPVGGGKYYFGEAGEYYFEDNPKGTCIYKHRRKIKWQDKQLLKEDMSTNLAYSLGALLTVYSLDDYASELDALIAGELYTPAEKPQRIRDIILDGLMELDGKEFEEFVSHLLGIIGFTADTTQYVSDKGIDVNGSLDAEGLATITLRVQVKRLRSTVGNKEVLALRGTLSQGEHGCLITLSSFSPQAYQEAQASGKIQIKLIDGHDLAILIMKHFDDIDDDYKRRFNMRKKKDFNLEEQFETYYFKEAHIEIKQEEKEQISWDTLVCAAKEDGFIEAFLGQKAWWAVRLSTNAISHIKYIAMYQIAPVSKITYYGKVDRIEPYENTGKYKLFLKGDPIKLENPVGLGKNPHLKPQGPKYTKLDKILKAKTLDDIFR